MKRELVFVHGRSQQHKDSAALKQEWIDALNEGLSKSGLTLPIPESDVHFPYYGDALNDLVEGASSEQAAAVVVRGTAAGGAEMDFISDILAEIQVKSRITDAQLAEVSGGKVVQRGPLNWEWVQSILKAVDRFVPHGSGASIALFTHDVYQYISNRPIREQIHEGILKAFTPGVETVVVSHSLGTVVAYNLLRSEGQNCAWKTPLFVTLGSPLGIKAVRKAVKDLAAPTRCPECVSAWFNAMDERDVVALYPLTPGAFPLSPQFPAIENKIDVRNRTENRHGIGGYLDDPEVARRIYNALTV